MSVQFNGGVMRSERLIGRGDVLDGSAVVAGACPYELDLHQPAHGRRIQIDVAIEIPATVATRLLRDATRATLRIEDGRQIDFIVSSVRDGVIVDVTADGPLR